MADLVKQLIAKPIQLADQVSKAAEEAHSFKQECLELKSKTEKLAALLRQAARAGSDLYERPTRRILDETEQVLDKALSLVAKCRANGLMKRVFTIIPTAAFKKMLAQLENSTVDVSWLLRVSAASDGYLGLPPIAANEPILCLIWEQIATLYTGSLDDRSDAAASLVSLARDNDRYGKLIIEEGGIVPLLKLVKEGRLEGQENAARAIGLLGRDPESVEHMIQAGVCSVFAKILKDAPMKVQAMVAWAVAELASSHPKCQDHFAQNNIIRLLVGHLAFETVQEHSKYTITSQKNMSAIVAIATNNPRLLQKDEHSQVSYPNSNQIQNGGVPNGVNSNLNLSSKPNQSLHNNSLSGSGSGVNMKGRESEDLATKTLMKSKAAEALWKLAKGNSTICKSITESRALLCFAVLLEKGIEEVQFNSAMALMEITAVAEKDAELRRSAFKPTSHAAKAVVDQVLKIIEKEDSDLLIPCVKVMGHLARTFKATETRIIGPLVQLMDETERDGEVSRQAAIALAKFACKDNYLHHDHAKAIISAGGAKHLIQMVYIGEQKVQISGLILLCWIALHVPDSEELAKTQVLPVLEWASKQGFMVQDPSVETLLHEAKGRLELYQSRGTRGFH